jgi:uncharacterized protein (TIGR03437 family)
MRSASKASLLLLTWGALCVSAQRSSAIVDAGYAEPLPRSVAPGQVVTLFVRGLAAEASTFDSVPLPTELGGVSVRARRADFDGLLPVFAVEPLDCRGGGIVCGLTAVTVQIPFEASVCPDSPLPNPCFLPAPFDVSVSENGVAGEEMRFGVVSDRVHVANSCDTALRPFLDDPRLALCFSLVAHADGDLVTGESPARPGESLVLYAFGLGPVPAELASGEPAAEAVQMSADRFLVAAEFTAFAPFRSPLDSPDEFAKPFYVGIVPGFVGLYQVNFTLPAEVPSEIAQCAGFLGSVNTTVTLAGSGSVDVGRICVAP